MMKTDYRATTFTGGFWAKKEALIRDVTTDAVYDRFYETGRVDAFRCDWKEGMDKKPHFFWDSDMAKWIEGAAYVLTKHDRPDLTEKIEWLIDRIEENQGEDGYFNIYFTVVEPENRFKNRDCHELYCAGHLIEAAVAYYEATGRDRLMRLMEKYVGYIQKVFVAEKSAAFETPGHEEIELALIRLYHATGNESYCDLSRHFIDRRGAEDNAEPPVWTPRYAQSHEPVRDMREAFGHSVRAMYLYAGMADIAMETGDAALLTACRALFDDVTTKKMYITGGIGSTDVGEAFTIPYDLPEAKAYTETCASIGLMFFANRMFAADPCHPSKYADIVELEMYNGALAGLSLDGESFFYENPLEIYLSERNRHTSVNHRDRFPITQRLRVFGCSCCPPNVTRVYSSLGQYFYAYDEDEGAVYVHQFGASVYEDGGIRVVQETAYPRTGDVTITANCPIYVRIPGWCHSFDADAAYTTTDCAEGYMRFDAGTIRLHFDMTPELIAPTVRVVRNIGKAALRRGPILYCAEGIDNGNDVHTLAFDVDRVTATQAVFDEAIGLDTLDVPGYRYVDAADALYAPLKPKAEPTTIRMIPYHAFANRGETDMLVYLFYR